MQIEQPEMVSRQLPNGFEIGVDRKGKTTEEWRKIPHTPVLCPDLLTGGSCCGACCERDETKTLHIR